jgi:DinB superfamily
MNKNEISNALHQNYNEAAAFINSLSAEQLMTAPEGKWNAIKQLDHLCKSVEGVNIVFKIPGFMVRWKFGVANRPSRTYDELIARYLERYAASSRVAPADFQPADGTPADREGLLLRLQKAVDKMDRGVLKMSEQNLDRLILPHPVLGKITLREMMYFTIFHAEYHHDLIKRYVNTGI